MVNQNPKLQTQFKRLMIFFIFFQLFSKFGGAVLPTYLFKQGLTINQILLGSAVAFFGQLFILVGIKFVHKKLSSRTSWQLAAVFYLAYIMLLVGVRNNYQFYFASFVGGFTTTLFYVFYNTSHFRLTPKNKVGHSSALMFNVSPIISMITPLVAGILAERSYYIIWFFTCLLFLVPFFLARKQYNFKMDYDFTRAMQEIRTTRALIFLEGVWEALVMGIIPIYTLFFIKDPLHYGGFLAYLSLVSVTANLILGKLSDSKNKRTLFLLPITLILTTITFAFMFANKNIFAWFVLSGIVSMLLPLFWNFSTAMVVDATQNMGDAMIGREYMLMSGRAIGLLVAFVSFSFEAVPYYIFLFLACIMLAYSAILFYRFRFSPNYAYL